MLANCGWIWSTTLSNHSVVAFMEAPPVSIETTGILHMARETSDSEPVMMVTEEGAGALIATATFSLQASLHRTCQAAVSSWSKWPPSICDPTDYQWIATIEGDRAARTIRSLYVVDI